MSATAQSLFTSQPGISKQIRLLEDELGVEIFARSGKHLTHVTPAGEVILDLAGEMLRKADSIKRVAQEFSDETAGTLSIRDDPHTGSLRVARGDQAIHGAISRCIASDEAGNTPQVAQMAADGEVDFVIATEALNQFASLITLPCYRWNRCVVVPEGHPLASLGHCSLEAIAEHPIVTYTTGFTGRSKLDEAFSDRGFDSQRVVFTAVDSDVIKTYVRLGLGVGLIAGMAYDPQLDGDLIKIDVSHLFANSVTSLGFRKGSFLRGYMHDFIHELAPHSARNWFRRRSPEQS